MEWIINNIDWILSGIGVSLPLTVIGWLYSKRKKEEGMKIISNSNSPNSALIDGDNNTVSISTSSANKDRFFFKTHRV